VEPCQTVLRISPGACLVQHDTHLFRPALHKLHRNPPQKVGAHHKARHRKQRFHNGYRMNGSKRETTPSAPALWCARQKCAIARRPTPASLEERRPFKALNPTHRPGRLQHPDAEFAPSKIWPKANRSCRIQRSAIISAPRLSSHPSGGYDLSVTLAMDLIPPRLDRKTPRRQTRNAVNPSGGNVPDDTGTDLRMAWLAWNMFSGRPKAPRDE